ncbi:MAG: dephospho-CoA kinase [Vicinamibacterales bacterium]
MLKVALTGGIATGKSHVVAELRRRGIPCVDADELAHGVMTPGSEATIAIAERFGTGVLDVHGAVDRKALGAIVFADPLARRELEAITHPAVYRAITAAMRAFALLGGADMVVVDIPLLFEGGRAPEFDRVVATVCSEPIQRERLSARGLSASEIDLRLAAQLSAAEKAARADHVIDTSGTYEQTGAQVDELLKVLRQSR